MRRLGHVAMKRWAASALLVGGTAALAIGADPAVAAPTCSLSGGVLSLALNGSNSGLGRSGTAIVVSGTTCSGAPTVDNTDTIQVTGTAAAERFRVNLRRGLLAPGLSAEGTGASEIEVSIDLGGGVDALYVNGSDGNDEIQIGQAGVSFNADDDADDLTYTNAETVVFEGRGGADVIGHRGATAVVGSPVASALTIYGGAGDDDLEGGDGSDRIYGEAGHDLVVGGAGHDLLRGDAGDDDLAGGDGADTIYASAAPDGNDAVAGGPGRDTVTYGSRTAPVRATSDGAAGDGDIAANEQDNVGLDVEVIVGGSGNDVLGGTGSAATSLRGRAGNDVITGTSLADVIYGGTGEDTIDGLDGNDVIWGELGADDLDGGAGDDTFREIVTPDTGDVFVGGAGTDTMDYRARGGPTRIVAGDGANDGNIALAENDSVGADIEVLLGGKSDDILGAAVGVDSTLRGGRGADALTGNTGNDHLEGGPDLGDSCDGGGQVGDTFDTTLLLGCESTTTYAVNDTFSIGEDGAATDVTTLTDNDAGASPFTISAVSATTGGGTVTLTGGVVAYTPGGAFEHLDDTETGTDTFTYDVAGTNGTTDTATVTVTVNGANDAPVGVLDRFDGVANTLLEVGRSTKSTWSKAVTGNIFTNDTDVDGETVAVAPTSGASRDGGTFVTFADGSFTYQPSADVDLDTDSDGNGSLDAAGDEFSYSVSDGTTTGAGTVRIVYTDTVWWVSPAASAAGTGTTATPFTTTQQAGAVSAANHTIYVDSNGTTATGGITLKAGQKLTGEGVALVSGADTLAVAGAKPTLSNSAGNIVTLGSGNTVRGLTTGDSTNDFLGSNVGTLTMNTVISNGSGSIIDVDGGALAVTFESATSSGSAVDAIDLNNVTGSITFTAAPSITNAANSGVDITNSPTFTSTMAGLTMSGTGSRLIATNAGTLNISSTTNTIGTPTAVNGNAVNISGTSLGINGMKFASMSSSGGSSGITLTNVTGGAFAVLGGASAGTGGTLQNSTGSAVAITNTPNVSLARMAIDNTANDAVSVVTSSGFSLTDSSVANAGTDGTGNGLMLTNVSGTTTLNRVAASDARGDLVRLENTNSNGTLTVRNGTWSGTGTGTAGNGFAILPNGTSSVVTDIEGATFTNIDQRAVTTGSSAASSNGTSQLRFVNNTITGGNGYGGGVLVSGQEATTTNITWTGNGFTNVEAAGLLAIDGNDTSVVNGTIASNTINGALHDSVGVLVGLDEAATVRTRIANNSLTNVGSDAIQLIHYDVLTGDLGASALHAIVSGNTSNGRGIGPSQIGSGVYVASSRLTTDTTCVSLTGNTDVANVNNAVDPSFFLRRPTATGQTPTFNLERGVSGSPDPTTVVNDNNNEVDSLAASLITLVANGTCQTPQNGF